MNISIDGRGITLFNGSGIGTYTENLVKELINLDNRNKYTIFWAGENYESFKKENTTIVFTSKKHGMFYEDFFDMPQHGYANAQPAKTIGQTDFSYDVRACVELGGRWSLSGKKSLSTQLAVGLFAEYGVLNTLKGGNNNLVDVDYSKYMSVKMNHIYTTLSSSLASVLGASTISGFVST